MEEEGVREGVKYDHLSSLNLLWAGSKLARADIEIAKKPIAHQLADDLIVKSVTAPYLLATKIEAFNFRGNRDFLASHDFEDIINVISGRIEIAEEVNIENEKLKKHLENFFEEMLKDDEFITALPAHINEGPATEQRLETVTNRIRKIAGK